MGEAGGAGAGGRGREVAVEPALAAAFPGLRALLLAAGGLDLRRRDPRLDEHRAKVFATLRGRHTLEGLRERPHLKAYRAFYWRIGLDPTKTRPAAEALLRRIVAGRELPAINPLVDAYNLVSAETEVAIAAFDAAAIPGPVVLRRARPGEAFLGIGMERPRSLAGGEVVAAAGEEPIALYPHRDAEGSKVTEATTEALLLICGVPGIPLGALEAAAHRLLEAVDRFCRRP